ncbi:hypothetical protein Glove_519g65 [Diversispora epigaea]|uniref:Ribonucleases P/MRP subunit Pop8-like domain-containing protein n=1 Tax=Diversispora epigaea TaxID=1348612 RepID=A0A397GEZ5_9GLOM|nr:hypothetical protein Glove_519g65 [Diversispora epigaea]
MNNNNDDDLPKYVKYTITKPEWHYLKFKINFDPPINNNHPLPNIQLRTLITKSLTETFGTIGSGINVTILNWNGGEQKPEVEMNEGELNEEKKEKNQKSNSDPDYVGILRVHRKDLTTLWSALTLFSTTLDTDNNKEIWFEILSNSSYLMGLVTDSRDWTRKIIAD